MHLPLAFQRELAQSVQLGVEGEGEPGVGDDGPPSGEESVDGPPVTARHLGPRKAVVELVAIAVELNQVCVAESVGSRRRIAQDGPDNALERLDEDR